MELKPLIHVIDDKSIYEFLSWVLGSLGLVINLHDTLQNFINKYDPMQLSCLLLNVDAKDEGIKLKNVLDEKKLSPPIIFTSWQDDISLAVNMMQTGACDFLLKPLNEELLIEGVNKALRIDKSKRDKTQKIEQAKIRFLNLSHREKQILQNIVEGKSNRTIALDINISPKTVEAHRASMMKKMNIKSISTLVKVFYEIKNYK